MASPYPRAYKNPYICGTMWNAEHSLAMVSLNVYQPTQNVRLGHMYVHLCVSELWHPHAQIIVQHDTKINAEVPCYWYFTRGNLPVTRVFWISLQRAINAEIVSKSRRNHYFEYGNVLDFRMFQISHMVMCSVYYEKTCNRINHDEIQHITEN